MTGQKLMLLMFKLESSKALQHLYLTCLKLQLSIPLSFLNFSLSIFG